MMMTLRAHPIQDFHKSPSPHGVPCTCLDYVSACSFHRAPMLADPEGESTICDMFGVGICKNRTKKVCEGPCPQGHSWGFGSPTKQ